MDVFTQHTTYHETLLLMVCCAHSHYDTVCVLAEQAGMVLLLVEVVG